MVQWFGRRYEGLPAEREAELWKLIHELQVEKEALRAESRRWQELYLRLAGIGDQTVPAQHVPEKVADEGPGVLGRHVSLLGLRHKYEERARKEAAKVKHDTA